MTQPEEMPSSLGSAQRIQSAVAGLFSVHDVTVGLPGQPDVIRLPKTETAQDVIDCEREIERMECYLPIGGAVFLYSRVAA